jgi:hypothetical protein
MKLMIDSGNETFNMLLEKFQSNIKIIKPEIPDNILHIMCYDYLKSIQQGKINDYEVLKKHLPDDDISQLFYDHKLGLEPDDYEIEITETDNTSNIVEA